MAKNNKFEAELGLNTQDFDQGIDRAGKGVKGFGSKVGAMAATITAVIGVVAIFTKAIVNSSEKLSDKFSFAVAGAKGVLHEFLNRMANADFSNFITGLTDSYKGARDLAQALDALKDKQAYISYATDEKKQQSSVLEEIVKDKSGKFTLAQRQSAAAELKKNEEEIRQITQKSIDDTYRLEVRGWELKNKLSFDKSKENYEAILVLEEDKLKKLDDTWKYVTDQLGLRGDKATKKFKEISKNTGVGSFGTMGITQENVTLYLDYLDMMKEESDLIPKLYEILSKKSSGQIALQDRYISKLRMTNELLQEEAFIASGADGGNAISTGNGRATISGLLDTNKLAGPPKFIGDTIKEMSIMQEQLVQLSDSFAQFFTNIDNGFKGMVDGLIQGIKRLVAELIAKAVILTILTLITGGTLPTIQMFKNILPFGLGSSGGGSSPSGGLTSATGVSSGGGNLTATISTRELKFALQRSGEANG